MVKEATDVAGDVLVGVEDTVAKRGPGPPKEKAPDAEEAVVAAKRVRFNGKKTPK